MRRWTALLMRLNASSATCTALRMYNPKKPKGTILDELIVQSSGCTRVAQKWLTLLDDEVIGHVVFHIISLYGRVRERGRVLFNASGARAVGIWRLILQKSVSELSIRSICTAVLCTCLEDICLKSISKYYVCCNCTGRSQSLKGDENLDVQTLVTLGSVSNTNMASGIGWYSPLFCVISRPRK